MSERESEHGGGYVWLYRKLLSSTAFHGSANLLKVWIWCLLRANWQDSVCIFEGDQLHLKRGSFITGRFTGSKECKMKPKTFYNQLQKLAEFGNIVLKSDNKKTLIVIVNYGEFQNVSSSVGQEVDNRWTTDGQQMDTDKEVKKVRSKEGARARTPESAKDVENYLIVYQPISSKNYISTEAAKFFDHFTANGWKVGGKTAMRDWQAAARNWLRNASEFNKQPPPPSTVVHLKRCPTHNIDYRVQCPACISVEAK